MASSAGSRGEPPTAGVGMHRQERIEHIDAGGGGALDRGLQVLDACHAHDAGRIGHRELAAEGFEGLARRTDDEVVLAALLLAGEEGAGEPVVLLVGSAAGAGSGEAEGADASLFKGDEQLRAGAHPARSAQPVTEHEAIFVAIGKGRERSGHIVGDERVATCLEREHGLAVASGRDLRERAGDG